MNNYINPKYFPHYVQLTTESLISSVSTFSICVIALDRHHLILSPHSQGRNEIMYRVSQKKFTLRNVYFMEFRVGLRQSAKKGIFLWSQIERKMSFSR